MALKMAHRRVDRTAEPELKNLIDEAERQLTEALQELRELARGLHPSVLADEGLAAALDSFQRALAGTGASVRRAARATAESR